MRYFEGCTIAEVAGRLGVKTEVRAEAHHQMPPPRRDGCTARKDARDERPSKLVPFAAAMRRPDPARVAEFAETARRLQRERAAVAQTSSTSALRDTPRAAWPRLRRATRAADQRRAGATGTGSREAPSDTDPREALAIAELAAVDRRRADAGFVSRDHARAVPRACVEGSRSGACRISAATTKRCSALDRAEKHLEEFGTLAHDRAIVRFFRATLLQASASLR